MPLTFYETISIAKRGEQERLPKGVLFEGQQEQLRQIYDLKKRLRDDRSQRSDLLKFQLDHALLQSFQFLNTTQKDQLDQRNQTPTTTTDREGFREGRV